MIKKQNSKQQVFTANDRGKQFISEESLKSRAKSLGDWDGKVLAADPDPEMITNPHYWNAYCLAPYQRYLKKYGINQLN